MVAAALSSVSGLAPVSVFVSGHCATMFFRNAARPARPAGPAGPADPAGQPCFF